MTLLYILDHVFVINTLLNFFIDFYYVLALKELKCFSFELNSKHFFFLMNAHS